MLYVEVFVVALAVAVTVLVDVALGIEFFM